MKVHRAVAAAFHGPCPDGLQVNHKDGNKENNRPENLEYVTGKENMQHSQQLGLHAGASMKGERNPSAKLTADDVRKIRALYPTANQVKLAVMFGVTQAAIWYVLKGRTWKSVPL